MQSVGVRFPLEPLLHAAGTSLTLHERASNHYGLGDPVQLVERSELRTLADLLGVSDSLLRRRLVSGISEWEADRWCLAIGVHPCALWNDWIVTGLEVDA